MATLRDTQDVLILEQPANVGSLRDTQDVLIFETPTQGFGHLRATQDTLIFELPAPITGLVLAPIVITYPLSIPPGPPGPSRVRLGRMAAVAKTESPITFQQQIQDWQQRRWELEMNWPPMTWAQAAPFQAFLDALGGQAGTFLAGDPLAKLPRGSAQGSPVTSGATNLSGSSQLVTSGWLPNQAGVLLPRDYVQLQASYSTLTIVTTVVTGSLVTITAQARGSMPSWLIPGLPFYVSGTGLADGGPFVVVSATLSWGGIYVTIVFYDAAATTGSSGGGLFSPVQPPQRLFRVMAQSAINTDGGGNATIDIFPPLRETLTAGTPLLLQNTMGTFRMTENRVLDEMDSKKTVTISLKAIEAL